MTLYNLTELMYSTARKGPFALYIFHPGSEYHAPPVWFDKIPAYPEEGEVTVANAKFLAGKAMDDKREVRVCDGGDKLVFHAKNGKTLYPKDAEKFWSEIA